MQKAILEIDLPESCGVCPLRVNDTINYRNWWCAYTEIMLSHNEHNNRHKDCPLKIINKELKNEIKM